MRDDQRDASPPATGSHTAPLHPVRLGRPQDGPESDKCEAGHQPVVRLSSIDGGPPGDNPESHEADGVLVGGNVGFRGK